MYRNNDPRADTWASFIEIFQGPLTLPGSLDAFATGEKTKIAIERARETVNSASPGAKYKGGCVPIDAVGRKPHQ
jgi:hypothetical protein